MYLISVFVVLFSLSAVDARASVKKNFTQPDVGFFWDTLRIGSWNIMGMPWLPFRSQAIPQIFKEEFDVLHLQEVWDPKDQQEIINLGQQHGYRYHYLPTVRNGPNGCDFSNQVVLSYAEFYIYCLVTQQLPGPINTQQLIQPFPYPMNESCGRVAIGLSLGADGTTLPSAGQLCLSCLMNAMQDLENGPSAFGAIEICKAGQGKTYFNGGQNGQLILSKFKIKDVKESTFDALVSNRINIYATIKDIRIGFGHWAFNILEDYGPFKQYQYGATQIDHAKDFVSNNPDVIIGDFNSGVNYQPEGYEYLLANGYVDLITPQPVETWCDPSRLDFQLCINAGSYSAAIDHVMVKNSWNIFSRSARLWAQQPVVSDHVGVAATISKLWFTNKQLEERVRASYKQN